MFCLFENNVHGVLVGGQGILGQQGWGTVCDLRQATPVGFPTSTVQHLALMPLWALPGLAFPKMCVPGA